MSEPSLHQIEYLNERTGVQINVTAPTHREYRIITLALRGVFSLGDLDDLAVAEKYERALSAIAERAAPDHAADFEHFTLDELDTFVANYVRGCELHLVGDASIDDALAGEGTADPKS